MAGSGDNGNNKGPSLQDFESLVGRLVQHNTLREERLNAKLDRLVEQGGTMSSDIEVIRTEAKNRDATLSRLEETIKENKLEHTKAMEKLQKDLEGKIEALTSAVSDASSATKDKEISNADLRVKVDQMWKWLIGALTAIAALAGGLVWAVVTGKLGS